MRLHENPARFLEALQAAEGYYGIALPLVEKDYWICQMLQRLARSELGACTVFKGGTSLSKGYGLINRFSEDVDLAVFAAGRSSNQVKSLITRLSKEITQDCLEVNHAGKTSKGSKYRKVFYQYPQISAAASRVPTAGHIILEVSAFGNPHPFVAREISSFITGFLVEQGLLSLLETFDMHPFRLSVLDKRQTLCEKVVSLLRFSLAENPAEVLRGKIRHFYDLYFLLQDEDCQDYSRAAFGENLNALIAHDRGVFNEPAKWRSGDIRTSPLLLDFEEIWEELAPIYERELAILAYDSIPSAIEIKRFFEGFLKRVYNVLK